MPVHCEGSPPRQFQVIAILQRCFLSLHTYKRKILVCTQTCKMPEKLSRGHIPQSFHGDVMLQDTVHQGKPTSDVGFFTAWSH